MCLVLLIFLILHDNKTNVSFLCASVSVSLPFCVTQKKFVSYLKKQTTDYTDFVYENCDIKDKKKYRPDNIPVKQNWGQLLLSFFLNRF